MRVTGRRSILVRIPLDASSWACRARLLKAPQPLRGLTWSALLMPLIMGAAVAEPSDQGASSGALEEIIVTATRRSERLRDVPISVTAFSQEKIDAQGVRSIDDLARLTPGVTFQRNAMSSAGNYNDEGTNINIRGVDSTAGTSTIGIYIDDTPIQTRHLAFGSVSAFPALFDLDRVEVLRGPQGTLFGAGAEGGVVRFISPDPGLSNWSSYDRAELATTDGGAPSYEIGAAVGGPIIEDVLGFRASASFREDGGWVDRVGYTLVPNATVLTPTPVFDGNTTQKNANWSETATMRLALTWKVNEALQITPSLYYQRLYINDTAAYWNALSNPGQNVFYNGNALANSSTDPFYLGAVKLKWDLSFASLFSNTSYLSRSQHSTSDYTQFDRALFTSYGELPNTFPPPGASGYSPFQDTQRNFYQEVRLASNDVAAPIVWSTGLYYSRLNENVSQNIIEPTLNQEIINYTGSAYTLCTQTLPCPNGQIYTSPVNQVIDKQAAAFGELTYRITDTFKATVGVRVSRLTYTGSTIATGPDFGPTLITQASASQTPVTPKAVLSWQPERDQLVYLSAGKGFRPGGVNVGVGTLCNTGFGSLASFGFPLVNGQRQVPGQFSSDSLWSYELGSKTSFFDHRLQINASVFYVDWNNIQQNVYLSVCGNQFAANLGKARSEGADIEVIYTPFEALLFDFTAAYTDAKYTTTACAGVLSFNGSACVGVDPATGSQLTAAPISSKGDALLGAPWALTASSEYHFAEWAGKKPYVRVDYQYSTAQRSLLPGQDPNNASFDTSMPGLPVTNNLNARAGVRFNGLDLSMFANNLTNSNPRMFETRDIATAPGVTPVDLLYFSRGTRPRTVGVTATYRY